MQYTFLEVPVDGSPPLGIVHDFAAEVADGSWAVLIVLGALSFYLKRPFEAWMGKQLELLDHLQESLKSNTETLKTMAETDRRTSEVLNAIETRNAKVDQLIDGIQRSNDENHKRTQGILAEIAKRLES